MMLPG